MRKLTQLTTFIAAFALFVAPAFSDTLVLKNGEKISGYFEGGSARVIKFRTSDGAVKDYDLLSIQQIQFGDEKTAASPSPSNNVPASNNAADPRLLPGAQRVTRPTSSNAANTGWTIPTGSKVLIRMLGRINSEKNKAGETCTGGLVERLSQGG